MKKRTNKKNNQFLLFLIVLIVVCAAVYIVLTYQDDTPASPTPVVTAQGGPLMSVMAIDVGQGDSILVMMETGETMLIDAGKSRDAASIKEELDERQITRIDVLIATHPHADHIGGMTEIVKSYEVGLVYMPDMTSDSQTYKTLKKTIEERNIPLLEAYAGITFRLGAAVCTIVSPEDDTDKDANNESVVLFLDYLDTEFLFTGDMEAWAEGEVLAGGYNVDADVLKVGHHGSSTSTSERFLEAVSPEYAVISCGEGNSYGHPHEETLLLFDEYGIDPLRTDLLGDVLFISDGKSLRIVTGD